MKRQYIAAIALCSLLISSFVFLGCEVGSSDSASRDVGVDFTGVYDSREGGPAFVSPANSGALVTRFNLRQSGDQLEAIDNNNIVFSGALNEVDVESGTAEAGFRLDGSTTAGETVTISGTLTGNGDTGQMKGTWIEPGRYCYVDGDATINTIQTNQPGTGVSISPTSATLSSTVTTQVFSASGGSGSFSWSVSGGSGFVSPTTGSSVTYTRTAAGDNTVKVTDQNDSSKTASASISQP